MLRDKEELLFYYLLQGFGVNLMIGSPALTLNLLSTFILWTGYSANVSYFQLHLNFFF